MHLAKPRDAPEDIFTAIVNAVFVPRPPDPPPTPPVSAFNAQGELVDADAIMARDAYASLLHQHGLKISEYETAQFSELAAKAFFRRKLAAVSTEADAIHMIESVHRALSSRVSAASAERFHDLVHQFLIQFNIRYEVRRPFALHATMSGVFSMLLSEIKLIANADVHVAALVREFEEAYADLKSSRSQARIKTCLQKQFNLLEGLGRGCPNVTASTLGAICNQLDWPHEKVKEAGKNLYGFGSDYPGVRHAGTPANALRDLNMTDFISISLMLASLAPYLAFNFDSERCYSAKQ